MIELVEYHQNQFIAFQSKRDQEHNSNTSNEPIAENAKVTKHRFSSSNPALNELRKGSLAMTLQDSDGQGTNDKNLGLLVRHLLDVKNTRFLYTKRVYELIHHHLMSGFDYRKYRKTDYIDVDQVARRRNFLDGYLDNESNYYKQKATADLGR